MTRRTRILLKIAGLLPLGGLVLRALTGDLTANPISYLTNQLGDWTLRLLLIGLAITPLRILTGQPWPIAFRRLIGLFAFAYAALHFGIWLMVDHFFDWHEMATDILKRRYITVGMLALTLLIPLAVTSTSGMIKRLGGVTWRRLHRAVYFAAIAGVLHFLWLAKKGRQGPFYYAAILVLLLGIRVVDWTRRRVRKRLHASTRVPQPSAAPH
jgi:sulfoxide reductase heme-binding subunit YedZ